MTHIGLKKLRNDPDNQAAPVEPNKYWERNARPKCKTCGKKIRGLNHTSSPNCKAPPAPKE